MCEDSGRRRDIAERMKGDRLELRPPKQGGRMTRAGGCHRAATEGVYTRTQARVRACRILVVAIAISLLPPMAVHAQQGFHVRPSDPELDALRTAQQWHLSIEGLATVPLLAGVGIKLEAPFGLRLQGAVGTLPGAFVDFINIVGRGLDLYDERVENLLSSSVKRSLITRIQVGWNPVKGYGFYLNANYGLMALSGVFERKWLLLQSNPEIDIEEDPRASQEYFIDAMLHMVGLELGWDQYLVENLSIRVALGMSFTVASTARIALAGGQLLEQADLLGLADEQYMESLFESSVHAPYLSVALGYRFF
jgi:hypothetical protein